MVAIATLALYIWVPFVLLIFSMMPPRRAVIYAYIGGWLFLPMLSIKLSGIPDLTKITAASLGVMLGTVIYDPQTLLKFRPKWYDLPMLVWCLAPFYTSVVNDLGAYDGTSNVIGQLGLWGIPYFIGRLYFNSVEGFKELAIGIIVGALVYLPLCYLEMRTSPMLHRRLYGFNQHTIAQTKRPIPLFSALLGDFRPMVFMQSSLALAMYMTTSTLVAFGLWISGAVKKIGKIPLIAILPVLFVTTVLCRTMAASAFMCMGIASLLWIRWLKSAPGLVAGLPLLCLAAVPPVYMYLRASEVIPKDKILSAMESFTSEERLLSLDVRLSAEDKVTENAFLAPDPNWGWGKWDPQDPQRTPWRVYQEYEKLGNDGMTRTIRRDIAPTDGLWIITMGQFGLVGVIALTATIVMPAFVLWKRVPLRYWTHRAIAPIAALAILLLLHMIDNLLNGMINSLFMLALGGISGFAINVRKISRKLGPQTTEVVLAQASAGIVPPGRPAMPTPGIAGGRGYGPAAVGPAFSADGPMGGVAIGGQMLGGQPAIPGFPVIAGLQPARRAPRRPRQG